MFFSKRRPTSSRPGRKPSLLTCMGVRPSAKACSTSATMPSRSPLITARVSCSRIVQRHVGNRDRHTAGSLFPTVGLDVDRGLVIAVEQHHGGAPGIHHGLVFGIDNGRIQTGRHGHGKKGRRDQRPLRQSEGDVADPQHRGQTQLVLDQPDGAQGFGGAFLLGADRQGQAIDDDIPHPVCPDAGRRCGYDGQWPDAPRRYRGCPYYPASDRSPPPRISWPAAIPAAGSWPHRRPS